jgi:hypothetical protein
LRYNPPIPGKTGVFLDDEFRESGVYLGVARTVLTLKPSVPESWRLANVRYDSLVLRHVKGKLSDDLLAEFASSVRPREV